MLYFLVYLHRVLETHINRFKNICKVTDKYTNKK